MSKKKRKQPPIGDLILARLVVEREWAYQRRIVDGLSWAAVRSLAPRPDEHGGIGRELGIVALKGMVDAHRAELGGIVGTREERIERRQLELDELALLARASLARAAFPTDPELSATLDEKAAKVLLDVRAAESKMHGDDAALRIEADVTTHDAADAELDAMLARMPGRKVES